MDERFGDYLNHDLAGYHVAVNADVPRIDVAWIDEVDPHVNPMGAKGIGEIGMQRRRRGHRRGTVIGLTQSAA
jgi:xanthine dehydrogenase YagR molybdenum-binding subunit